MTKIKFCGLMRPEDIRAVNELKPDYAGFVFYEKSRRYLSVEEAETLKEMLLPDIQAVGVFVDAPVTTVADLLQRGIIDAAQLHGREDETYLQNLREKTDKPILQAFRIRTPEYLERAERSDADMILLDAGAGDGKVFDWSLLQNFGRPYFLAGGLDPSNAGQAVRELHPYGLDVSSGIETEGRKDKTKMAAFMEAVRKENRS